MGYIGVNTEEQTFLPYDTFEDEVIDPISGIDLNETEIVVAKYLLRATTDEPIRQKELIAAVCKESGVALSERAVRVLIREFRRTRGFPICSRKGSPAGYWWGRTEREVEEFANVFLAQIKDEASTVAMMLRKNYPRLAGQMKLGFGRIANAVETVATDRVELERSLTYYKKRANELNKNIDHLLRRLAATQGQNTKLRKRIAELKKTNDEEEKRNENIYC